ncbi:hypothetical protein M0765_028870 [Variovorax sp. S2]|uniref:hypothetical protein n=1 Tax=Variovorax sp. S12S4 TaxID=3029170 RepID=UPI00215CA9E4|nr:hypothetical protein [Variovorax sp. S12S4]MCR8956245.1 hypothetical protein [Variovorax sp. S12S4]MCR8961596.1 hypothetical protein [Variovorax sp. S12S4]
MDIYVEQGGEGPDLPLSSLMCVRSAEASCGPWRVSYIEACTQLCVEVTGSKSGMQREPSFDPGPPTAAFFNGPAHSPEWLGSSFAAHGVHTLLNMSRGKNTLKFGGIYLATRDQLLQYKLGTSHGQQLACREQQLFFRREIPRMVLRSANYTWVAENTLTMTRRTIGS